MNKKETWFLKKLSQHRNLVSRAAAKIVKTYPEFKELNNIVKRHDLSKLKNPEHKPYVEVVWYRRKPNYWQSIPDNQKTEITNATKHHCATNPHHPEFWKGSTMPDIAIAEMVADWVAVGIELGNSVQSWFKQVNGTRWKFSKHQVELIKKLMKVFK